MATEKQTTEQLNALFTEMEDYDLRMQQAEEALNNLRISNAKKLADLQINLMNKKAVEEENLNQQINENLLQRGISIQAILKAEELKKALDNIEKEYAEKIAAADKAHKKILENEKKAKKKAKEKEVKDTVKDNKKVLEEIDKAKKAYDEAYRKDKNKKDLSSMKTVIDELSTVRIGGRKRARAKLEESGITDKEEQDKALRAGSLTAVYNALSGFAKQLENTATEVAEAQTEIDTRLQGSKNEKSLTGSYWKEMSFNIGKNIGMSPFLKQSDAVNSLKTLVGKGISFNVEQRAFLETISDKIATTFEATDASLLKLVRIQQADSTAARLGMESALTAFLNNMYETTEYMTEAADAIRGSIYEASALMSAEEATEFEYQVQKWMGSLYSVGFNSTQGLADALGKLAAGDISGITDGGFGNLLVMAANQTGDLSITEILQDGLNNDETNKLMQAMVEYLGNIYEETKNNKVVAQQFANVYGLTASDLKAAANLAQSTQNIYNNNEFGSYGQMLNRLNSMANSMGSRTQLGTMIQNVFENLKYSTAATIGNDPMLYTTYMIASMLDDTVGGIAIPTIGAFTMGNGAEVDLETTVADLMRTGAMAGGLLGGIGKMIAGLGTGGGFSGSGMLKAFGINTNNNSAVKITRGTGSSLMTTTSGADVSLAGYVGNADGEVVKNKALTDAKDDANKQAIEALEESQEIGMSNIDEHIVQIYTLLDEVVSGSRVLHVLTTNSGDNSPWTNNTGYSPSGIPRL